MNNMTEAQIPERRQNASSWKVALIDFVSRHVREFFTAKPRHIHLAVFNEPYLTLVLEQKKTLESRFSINRCAPFQEVTQGDIVLLKLSGGPILGIATVGSVEHLHITGPEDLGRIAAQYSSSLCIDGPTFWEERKNSAYCTLIELRNVERIEIERVGKRDRQGWVVLQSEQMELFPGSA
jgi:hypothetical protein